MNNASKTDLIASTLLGKKIDGCENYNPKILVAVPRQENRKIYGIKNDNLPFLGFDVWHCYEFSVMTNNNLPITRLLKLKYPCNSEFIIESKSLKLYLNSFNMSCFGENTKECLDICKNIIAKDLSSKLETDVEINFMSCNTPRVEIFKNYTNLTELVDENNLQIKEFKETPELLEIEINEDNQEHYLMFDSLRSNCRVTHQPDFGDVFIYYCSNKTFTPESLIKYLSSFRCEYHFHEECCEMIYKRLYDLLDEDDELFVGALYTRRGGIDISPMRYSKNVKLSDIEKFINLNIFSRYGIKQ